MAIDRVALGKLIAMDRQRLGINQKGYGKPLGISQTRMSELETGQWKRPLSYDLVEALKKKLGLDALPQTDGDDPVVVKDNSAAPERPNLALDRALRSIRADFEAGRAVLQSDSWFKRLEHITNQAHELMTFPAAEPAPTDDAATRARTVIRDEVDRRKSDKKGRR